MKDINLYEANKIKDEIKEIGKFLNAIEFAPEIPKQYRRIFSSIKIETHKKFSIFGIRHLAFTPTPWVQEVEVPASVISDVYRLASDKKNKLENELLEVLKKEIGDE